MSASSHDAAVLTMQFYRASRALIGEFEPVAASRSNCSMRQFFETKRMPMSASEIEANLPYCNRGSVAQSAKHSFRFVLT